MKQSILAAAVIVTLATYPSRGAIIFDTGPFTADGGSMASDFSTSTNLPSPVQRAADFVLQNASQITRVSWWGDYVPGNTPPGQDDFTLRIFTDASGTPSSSPLLQFSLGDLGRLDTGIDSFGFRVYAYSALLASPAILSGGTTYWLSIVNNTASDTDDDWFWQRVTRFSGTVQQRGDDTSPWEPYSPSTLAFNIEGVVVPEPSTYALLTVGGVLVLLKRRLRRRDAA
jgi:hypothetical protein